YGLRNQQTTIKNVLQHRRLLVKMGQICLLLEGPSRTPKIQKRRMKKCKRSGCMGISHDIARDLLRIKAVQISPDDYFTLTSVMKSPIYCDNRLTMSYPSVRDKIADAFVELIEKLEWKPDVIAGCATAGIPHRSEERRVGKECRYRGEGDQGKTKEDSGESGHRKSKR